MRTQRASSTSPSRTPVAPENRSVARILDVLDLFLDGGATYTLKDVSEALGIPKSTAHGILHAMHRKGYLSVDPETKRYAVSLQLVGRLTATPAVEILRQRGRRHLERLSAMLGETWNPSRAYVAAGAAMVASGNEPNRFHSAIHPPTAPGTVTLSHPRSGIFSRLAK